MRTLSPVLLRAIFSESTREVLLALLKIEHPNLVTPIRVVNNLQPITSQGYTWAAFPFEITLPGEAEDELPVMTLRIDAVDRQIITAVRNLQGAPDITLDLIVASQPDVVEASFVGFKLKNVSYDNLTVEGELRLEEILSEPFPKDSFTPFVAPGLYGQY
jgi:hypothetical protein